MKKVILFAIIFVLANQFAFSWVKGGLGNGYLIFNPENDKDLVTTTKIDNTNSIFYIDIVNMRINKLPIVNEFALAISEKNNLLITGVPSFSKSNFALYNYKTGEKIFDFNQSGEIGNPNTSPYTEFLFCIDSTGKYFFSFNENNLTLITYDIYQKKTINTHVFDLNPDTIQWTLFMPGKNAICIINDNGTAQFFSLLGNHESNLPNIILNLYGQDVMTFENDNYFSWLADKKKICIQKIEPNIEPYYVTSSFNFYHYLFTKGMKHCLFSDSRQSEVVDTKTNQATNLPDICPLYAKTVFIDSTLTKSLLAHLVNMPTIMDNTFNAGASCLYLFDVVNKKLINSVPDGFVPSPYDLVINNDGSLLFANTGSYSFDYNEDRCKFGALVRVQDSTFIKYLYPLASMFVFTSDSKYLVSADSNSIYFLNTETEQIDKTIKNYNVSQRKVLFSSDDKLMYNVYANGIDVYDYPALNLIKSIQYQNNQFSDIVDVKWLNTGLTILTKDKIWWYAKDSDVLMYSEIPRISTKLKAKELSPKGDYVLLYSRFASEGSKDTFLVMNVFSKEIEYKYSHQSFADPFVIHFFGSHRRLTYSYNSGNSPMFPTFLSGINLETGVEKELVGMYKAFMHPTENGYFSASDYKYYYTGLPSELIVGVKDNQPIEPSLEIYPNPAGDFITIALKPSEGFEPSQESAIQIYNTLGEKVMYVSARHAVPLQINISALPKGIYFVKIGDEVAKFVKM